MGRLIEILVRVGNPEALQNTLSMLPGVASAKVLGVGTPEGPTKEGDCYIVRVFEHESGFLKFAMQNQGYATVVSQRDAPKDATA